MPDTVQKIAVKALIINPEGRVLLLQKSQDDARHAGRSGRYNLPGGKVSPGEAIEAALTREIQEETGLHLGPEHSLIFAGEWRPVVHGVPHQIVGLFYVCHDWTGTVELDDEHQNHVWIRQADMVSYDILPPEGQALETYFTAAEAAGVDLL